MFDWDDANATHVAEHKVSPLEAEEASTNKPIAVEYATRNGEERFVQIGETLAGRVLLVVSTSRNGLTRVITAHDVDLSKRKSYALKRDLQYAKENSS